MTNRDPAQNDPEVVHHEYADESGLAGRASLWTRRARRQPHEIAFQELIGARPVRVLEVGCGRREFAGGSLIATTNSRHQLEELWEIVGRDLSDRDGGFTRENGEAQLAKHFAGIQRRDLDTTMSLTAAEIRDYAAHSICHRHVAAKVPDLTDPLRVTVADSVFIASK